MLIIDDNSVYEIDEECIQKNNVAKECNLPIWKKEDEKKSLLGDEKRRWGERLKG